MAEERDKADTYQTVQEDGEPCGLIVKLEKNILWSERCGNDPILGYFDHMEFQPIDSWLKFSPRTTAVELDETDGKDRIEEHPLSMYPIKLLFPEQVVMDALNEIAGLDYTAWRGTIPELLKDNPCITVLLVNLTDEFKGEFPRDPCGKQLRQFAETIGSGQFLCPDNVEGQLIDYNRAWAQEAHFCIMPSLGYSDYCILLAERDWHFAPVLIEFLHRAGYMVPDTGSVIPILSTDYVIPAYHATRNETESEAWQCGVQLSMRIHLRPGVNMLALKQAMGEGIDIYQLSGSSDCALEARDETGFNRLLNLVESERSKGDREVREFQNLVVSTETSLRRLIPSTIPPCQTQMVPVTPSSRVQGQIAELREVLQSYWSLLRDEKHHMRQFNSMWTRVTSIENICREPHNRSLQEIMGPWLDSFTDCLRRCVEQAMADARPISRNEDRLYRLLKYVDEILETFIAEAGSLLADLSRSDCFFMESERYNHASVSSATALLIAYNRWQNQFVEDVLREDLDNHCQYAFLVRSGGCDTTTTNNIFYSLEPEIVLAKDGRREVLKESMPLITQMSEMSLFDCGGTVLRMTHECMHYCGERQRRERVQYIIGFAARYFGDYLAHILFDEVAYPQRIIENLRRSFMVSSKDLSDAILKAWTQGVEGLCRKIANQLEEELNCYYEADCKDWHEQNYLSDDLCQWMLEKLALLFYPYRWSEQKNSYPYSALVKFLRNEQRKTVLEFYDNCDAEIRKEASEITCLALDRSQIEAYIAAEELAEKNAEGRSKDWEETDCNSLTRVILCVLNQLLTDPDYKVEMPVTGNSFQGKGVLHALGPVIFDCFSECFADVEACRRLDVKIEDYLIGFAFEEWNVPNAIPLDAPFLFRIPAVLRVCFGDMLDGGASLSREAEDRLRAAMDSLVRHGMPELRRNEEELIVRTNQLLEQYQPLVWMAQPLEAYMRECDQFYQASPHSSMLKYQNAFRQIRLLGGEENGNVAQLFTSLVTIGEVSCVGPRG